jgi:hypothetical protein
MSGWISLQEFHKVLREELSITQEEMSDREMQDFFHGIDKSRDNRVDFIEFHDAIMMFGIDCGKTDTSESDLKQVRKILWAFLEYPASSRPAMAFSWIMFMVILLSTIVFVVSSLPVYHEPEDPAYVAMHPQLHVLEAFKTIENLCVALFSVEYLLRLITAPTPTRWYLPLLPQPFVSYLFALVLTVRCFMTNMTPCPPSLLPSHPLPLRLFLSPPHPCIQCPTKVLGTQEPGWQLFNGGGQPSPSLSAPRNGDWGHTPRHRPNPTPSPPPNASPHQPPHPTICRDCPRRSKHGR